MVDGNSVIYLDRDVNPQWYQSSVIGKYIRFKNSNTTLETNEIVKITDWDYTVDNEIKLNISPQLNILSVDAAVIHPKYPFILMLFKSNPSLKINCGFLAYVSRPVSQYLIITSTQNIEACVIG